MTRTALRLLAGSAAAPEYDFEGVEIAHTGTWQASTGEIEITLELLERLAANYAATEQLFAIPLKFGHGENGNLLEEGHPAAGYLHNVRLRREKGGGAALLADIETVSDDVDEVILSGAYSAVSVEIAPKLDDGHGKEYADVLIGLALLGADLPAVKGMKSIRDSYTGKRRSVAAATGLQTTTIRFPGGTTTMKSKYAHALKALGLPEDLDDETAVAKLAEYRGGAKLTDEKPDGDEDEKPDEKPDGDEGDEKPDGDGDDGDGDEDGDDDDENAELSARIKAHEATIKALKLKDEKRDKDDAEREVASIVDEAIGDGRMAPVSRDEFLALGAKVGPQVLRKTVDSMPAVLSMDELGSAEARKAAHGTKEVDVPEAEMAEALAMGMTREDVIRGERLRLGLPVKAAKS